MGASECDPGAIHLLAHLLLVGPCEPWGMSAVYVSFCFLAGTLLRTTTWSDVSIEHFRYNLHPLQMYSQSTTGARNASGRACHFLIAAFGCITTVSVLVMHLVTCACNASSPLGTSGPGAGSIEG